MRQKKISSENLVGRKNFKKEIGEIKNILREKFWQREIYQMEETKNVHPNKKNSANIFF